MLDQNWYELSARLSLPREGRNWVKELQSARNTWAHLSAQTPPQPSDAAIAAVLTELTALSAEINARWPDDVSALDAVQDVRRNL